LFFVCEQKGSLRPIIAKSVFIMRSLLITPKDHAELDWLANLLARLNITTTVLEDETITEPIKKPNRIQSLRGSIKGPAADSLNEHLKTIRSEW
jgi:hypothetical protein